jgi:hypothetical protein
MDPFCVNLGPTPPAHPRLKGVLPAALVPASSRARPGSCATSHHVGAGFQQPLASTSIPNLPASVSNAGGLGSLAAPVRCMDRSPTAEQHVRRPTCRPRHAIEHPHFSLLSSGHPALAPPRPAAGDDHDPSGGGNQPDRVGTARQTVAWACAMIRPTHSGPKKSGIGTVFSTIPKKRVVASWLWRSAASSAASSGGGGVRVACWQARS